MKIEGALETYITQEILPQVARPPYGTIESIRLSNKMPVYLLHDSTSDTKLVSKAFQYGSIPLDTAWKRAEKEYHQLKLAREHFGMDAGDLRIIKPLGKNRDLSALLVLEYGKGNTLDHYIRNAIRKNETEKLYYKLRLLARFLVKLHSNSQSDRHPTPDVPRKYLKKLLYELRFDLISEKQEQHIKELASSWWSREDVYTDYKVLIHGDATTSNFLFWREKVTGIDLEKAKWADRCWDLGFLAAELKHHFLNYNQSSWDSEPYIRHLLLEYAAGFRDLDMFQANTRRLPLFMALGLLRIARNKWITEGHRCSLYEEAKACLAYKP